MKVYTLMGGFDYEGESLIGVFASRDDVIKYVEQEKPKHGRRPDTLGYDSLGFVESELGQSVENFHGGVEWL